MNEAIFAQATQEIAAATQRLLDELVTTASPRNRATEAAKAMARSATRFAAKV